MYLNPQLRILCVLDRLFLTLVRRILTSMLLVLCLLQCLRQCPPSVVAVALRWLVCIAAFVVIVMVSRRLVALRHRLLRCHLRALLHSVFRQILLPVTQVMALDLHRPFQWQVRLSRQHFSRVLLQL